MATINYAKSMDLGGGWTGDLESGTATNSIPDEWGTISRRALTPDEMRMLTGYYSSPEYINGKAEAARQAAADNDWAPFNAGNKWMLPGLVMAGAAAGGAFAGAEGVGAGLPAAVGDSAALGMTGADVLAGGAGAAGSTGGSWIDQLMRSFSSPGGTDASWGVNQQPDFGAENMFGFEGSPSSGGFQMPSAVPESPAQLAEWGLKEVSPGNWALPGILGSASTAADWLQKIASDPKTWGQLLSAGLGAFGSNRQANSLTGLANQYTGYGAPSRARYEASMSPGFDPSTQIPGYSGALKTSMDQMMASLSASGGNPFGNPTGLIDANKRVVAGTALPAIQNYQALNANTGFGSSMQLGGTLGSQAIGADANTLNALGYGINAVTNPQKSLADMLKEISGGGLKLADGMSL